jgi:predicted N-acetyltransferase YhbS
MKSKQVRAPGPRVAPAGAAGTLVTFNDGSPGITMPRIETFVLSPSAPEIPACAAWRVEAFGVLATSIEAETKSLQAFTSDQSGQAALVAKLDGILAGTCLLVRSELAPCHPVSPWLAGLYVAPEHRRHGVGQVLVTAIEDQARQRGHRRLHLYTSGAMKYYERLGWLAVEQADWRGSRTTLMAREL